MARHPDIEGFVISEASDGDNTLVAAVPGKKIRVLSYALVASATGGVKFQSGATDISGLMPFAANGGASASVAPYGEGENFLFETAAGEALELNNAAGVDAFGHGTYFTVS